jgi:hypothetical protein
VHGKLPEAMQKLFNVGKADFFACGLSLVLHQKPNGTNGSCQLALFRNV